MTAGWWLVVLWALVVVLVGLVLVLLHMLMNPPMPPRSRPDHGLHVIDGDQGSARVYRPGGAR